MAFEKQLNIPAWNKFQVAKEEFNMPAHRLSVCYLPSILSPLFSRKGKGRISKQILKNQDVLI